MLTGLLVDGGGHGDAAGRLVHCESHKHQTWLMYAATVFMPVAQFAGGRDQYCQVPPSTA